MKRAKNPRRGLLVLTDGGDNSSSYSKSEVRTLVQESDVRIYSIGLSDRPEFLEKLGSDSGGRAFRVRKVNELPTVMDTLSRDFRNVYVLGYAPKVRLRDGRYRRIRVEVSEAMPQSPLTVFWRRGYCAPIE